MSELTEARKKTLAMIADAGNGGIRPRGAELTTTYWLRSKGLVEGFYKPGGVQPVYRITEKGRYFLPPADQQVTKNTESSQ
jgi:hypothetical protein